MKAIIKIPEGVNASLTKNELVVKGPKGEIRRSFEKPQVSISIDDKKIAVKADRETRNFKKIVNSIKAHIKNMIKGVIEGYTYKLRICYQHFPINVKIEKSNFIIENFYGEKKPRKAKILPEVNVVINGSLITVTGSDKESTGQTAANIESATRIVKRDKRIFQDGIWIISKGGDEDV